MPETAADRYQAARNNSDTVQRGGVTSSVNNRKVGPEADPRAYLERNPADVPKDKADTDFADDWQERYANLPGVEATEGDDRSPRERLLDGETVDSEDF